MVIDVEEIRVPSTLSSVGVESEVAIFVIVGMVTVFPLLILTFPPE